MDPCFASWADWMQEAWSADAPHRILDVCCGTGLMTLELLDRGHDVVGLDASAAMLEQARARLRDRATLVQAWLPELPVDGPFDAAVSTHDGLNYLTLEELRATFTALHPLLRPGGWFVFDVHGPAALPFALAHPVIRGTQSEARFTLTNSVQERTCTSTIVFESPMATFTEVHTQHLHDTADVTRALEESGFRVAQVVDEYSDRAATDETLRATWVARREEP